MRKALFGSLTAFLVGSSELWAQTNVGLPPPQLTSPPPLGAPVSFMDSPSSQTGNRVWGSAEYLLWRFKDAPLPIPLVATDFKPPVTDPVLFGGQSYSAGLQTGTRLTFGGWIDDEGLFGVEVSGFYMVPRTPTNFAMGTTSSSTTLAIPFNNVTPGGGTGGVFPLAIGTNAAGQTAFLISGGLSQFSFFPTTGSIAVTSSTSLWGADLNGVLNLYHTNRLQVNLLYGVRYLDLLENLSIDTQINDPNLGSFAPATFSDHFGTRNQFYGGQLGLKGEWNQGIFFVNALAKVALGVNHETVNIDGSFSDPAPIFLNNFGVGSGGLFAQRSNIGQYNHNRFMVVPQTQLQAGLNLGSHVRLFAGYDFMYMSSVVRPGNQIDNNINLSQVGANAGHGANALVGQASPGVSLQQSSFWAQGVSFGLEFRY